jgi:hypothetical protein
MSEKTAEIAKKSRPLLSKQIRQSGGQVNTEAIIQ